MMLQIGHRRSDDIDFFLQDPQLLSYLDPKLHDFKFEIAPSDYQGDGSRFLKLSFGRIGEIDFIVSAPLTKEPSTRRKIEGEDVDVETVAEIMRRRSIFVGHISSRETSLISLRLRSPTASRSSMRCRSIGTILRRHWPRWIGSIRNSSMQRLEPWRSMRITRLSPRRLSMMPRLCSKTSDQPSVWSRCSGDLPNVREIG